MSVVYMWLLRGCLLRFMFAPHYHSSLSLAFDGDAPSPFHRCDCCTFALLFGVMLTNRSYRPANHHLRKVRQFLVILKCENYLKWTFIACPKNHENNDDGDDDGSGCYTWRHLKQSLKKCSSIKVQKLFYRTLLMLCVALNIFARKTIVKQDFDSDNFDVCALWLEGKLLACNVINDLSHVSLSLRCSLPPCHSILFLFQWFLKRLLCYRHR